MMQSILTNWKTTLTGVLIIALGAAHTFAGINIPGFNLDFFASLTMGGGLIFASDGAAPVAK